jgi:hypothetical protein
MEEHTFRFPEAVIPVEKRVGLKKYFNTFAQLSSVIKRAGVPA